MYNKFISVVVIELSVRYLRQANVVHVSLEHVEMLIRLYRVFMNLLSVPKTCSLSPFSISHTCHTMAWFKK